MHVCPPPSIPWGTWRPWMPELYSWVVEASLLLLLLLRIVQVLCGGNTDEHYKVTRCPPDEWQRRWSVHGINSVWSNDVLPCRVYLRHCVLAAKGFCPEAYDSFLNNTYLADRVTTIRQYLQQHPEILDELPPPDLVGRYSG